MRVRPLAAVILVLGIGSSSSLGQDKSSSLGQDKEKLPTEVKDVYDKLDKTIVKSVYDTAELGTKIFNNDKNYEGCYRLYQGTLMAVQPMLKEYRYKLSVSVKEKMVRSQSMNAVEGAFVLRAALDEIQNEIAPGANAKPEAKKATATLWDRLGGTGGVSKIIDRVISRAIEEPVKIDLFRGKKPTPDEMTRFKQHLMEFISQSTGGPHIYTGKDMKTVHAGMKITNDQFTAFAGIVKDVLEKSSSPIVADEDIKEFMKLLESTRKDIVEVKTKD
jgi:hemoglobin